jgi:hypothetical protein
MAAFAKMRNDNRMTAGEAAFGAKAAEEEHQECQIPTSLGNLANASIQKNVTIDNLVASNAQLAQALQELQAAMVRMSPAILLHLLHPFVKIRIINNPNFITYNSTDADGVSYMSPF